MSQLSLSIIVPVYNVEEYLNECLESLVNQSLEDKYYEIILVNDGSTDNSINICNKYANTYNNIKVINQPNGGLSAARNTGIKNSTGKYISFVDSDDSVDITMYEKMLNVLNEFDVDIVSCNFNKMNEKSNIINNDEFKTHVNKVLNLKETLQAFCKGIMFPYACGKVYKRVLFTENNIIYPVGTNYEDILTTFSLLKNTKNSYVINEGLYNYRIRSGSITNTLTKNNILDLFNENYKTISQVYEVDDSIISLKDKKEYKNLRFQKLANVYHSYQLLIFKSLMYSEKLNLKDNYVFFGASQLGKQYLSYSTNRFENLYFSDNDKKKQNEHFCGYKVISPVDIKNIFKDDYKILITSTYIFDITKQLLDIGVINSISDILIFNGRTEIEKGFEEGFNLILSLNI